MMDKVRILISDINVASGSRRTCGDHNRTHAPCVEAVLMGVDADQFIEDNVCDFVADLSLTARRRLIEELEATSK